MEHDGKIKVVAHLASAVGDDTDLIYDLYKRDGKFFVFYNEGEQESTLKSKELLMVTEYKRFEVLTIQDLKASLNKKNIVIDHEKADEYQMIFSQISDENSFMNYFGEESISELVEEGGIVYYVKGKSATMTVEKFFKKYLEE